MKHVVITQPYVPAYRVPLFDALSRSLEEQGADLTVVSARPEGIQAQRGDAATGRWHLEVPYRLVKVGRWAVSFRSLPQEVRSADVLVSELEALNFLAWAETFKDRRVVLWGHGKSYVNDPSAFSDAIESRLARRAHHVMTYAPSGRDFVIARSRLHPSRVTAVGNSTDSGELRRATEALLKGEPAESRSFSALYVGGLDASKRIGFLIDAFEHAVRVEPDFTLTVVGRGAELPLLQAAQRRHVGLRLVHEARGVQLARLGVASRAMWIPGRVGLVAVDALAMGLPVHTTDFPYHAPEIEFLQADEVATLGPSPAQFAIQSLDLMRRASRRSLREDIPTIEKVVQKMTSAILGTAE